MLLPQKATPAPLTGQASCHGACSKALTARTLQYWEATSPARVQAPRTMSAFLTNGAWCTAQRSRRKCQMNENRNEWRSKVNKSHHRKMGHEAVYQNAGYWRASNNLILVPCPHVKRDEADSKVRCLLLTHAPQSCSTLLIVSLECSYNSSKCVFFCSGFHLNVCNKENTNNMEA